MAHDHHVEAELVGPGEFLASLSRSVLDPATRSGPQVDRSTPAASARASLAQAQQLLATFENAHGEVVTAQAEVYRTAAELQARLASQESKQQVREELGDEAPGVAKTNVDSNRSILGLPACSLLLAACCQGRGRGRGPDQGGLS